MGDLLGGAHKEIKQQGYEAHHLLAWEAYREVLDIGRGEGPCILMSKDDHKRTESWGSWNEAVDYRKTQSSLLKEGKFSEAWMMDVSDIRIGCEFNTKYDEHIVQSEKYLLELDQQKKIELDQKFKAELERRQEIQKEIEKKEVQLEKLTAQLETAHKQEVEQKRAVEREQELRNTIEELKTERQKEFDKAIAEHNRQKEQEQSKQQENLEQKQKSLDLYGDRSLTHEEYAKWLDKKFDQVEVEVWKYPKSDFEEAKISITSPNGKVLYKSIDAPLEGWSQFEQNGGSMKELVKAQRLEQYSQYLEEYRYRQNQQALESISYSQQRSI